MTERNDDRRQRLASSAGQRGPEQKAMLKCADTTAYSSHNRADEAHDLESKFAGIQSVSEGYSKNSLTHEDVIFALRQC